MKWTTTTALILAAGAGALGVNHLLTSRVEDPAALLARLEADERAGISDGREALGQLTAAIEAEGALDDPKVAISLLRARAARLKALGAYATARDDLETIRSTWLLNDASLELEIAELTAREGRTEDALRRMQRLVARDASNAAAQELLGKLEAATAAELTTKAEQLSLGFVTFKGVQRIQDLVAEAATRAEEDPHTGELIAELRETFKSHVDAPLSDVAELLRDAREANARAREAFARSMATAPNESAIVALAETLATVGRDGQALDLLLAARAVPALLRSASISAAMIPLLERVGEVARGREFVLGWDWKWGGDLEFYRLAATTLFHAGENVATHRAADAMAQSGGDLSKYWTAFFFPAAEFCAIEQAAREDPNYKVERDAVEARIKTLSSFARNTIEIEPFEGARAEAWGLVARAWRLLGNDEQERTALGSALATTSAPKADDWARIAELEARAAQPAWERVEQRYAHAMNAEPKRTSEFLPRWIHAGDQALAADGLEFREVLDEARNAVGGLPLRSVGTSVRWRIAQFHVREGRTTGGLSMAEQLLDELPNLIPALDTRIDAQLHTRAPFLVVDDILRRIELMGSDSRTEGFLAELGAPLSGPQLLRAMRAAPERFGRPTAAALALEEGDPARAAELLAPSRAVEYAPGLRLLRGRTRAAAGQLAGACEDLEPLLAHPTYGVEALDILLDVRLRQGDAAAVSALVTRAAEELLDTEGRLALVERLLSHGRTELAEPLLALLDLAMESRTPTFYRALVRHAALTRDVGRREVAIARAEPFLVDGTPELAELLLHIENRAWTEVPGAVKRLRGTEFTPSRFQEAVLTLLEERLANGRRLIDRGTAADPRSPEWALLRAASQALEGEPIEMAPWFGQRALQEVSDTLVGNRLGRRDPRETLAVLLTFELPAWSPWVDATLRRLEEQRAGRLWPLWLRVRLDQLRGERAKAQELIATVEKEYPDFGPAWDIHLGELRRRHVTEPLARELLQARVARLASLGERTLEDPVEIALARASQHILQGETQLAMTELGQSLDREKRDDFDAHFTRGALLASVGQYGLAVIPLREAAASAPPAAREAAADALVAATIRAANPAFQQRAVIARADLPARLEDAVRLFPSDPIVAAALVEHGFEEGAGPTQRAALARRELTRLRREAKGRPLESIRRGSVRAWVGLTLELAPELARELLSEELAARPGDIELWELAANVEARLGSEDEALALYATVLAVELRPGASHSYAAMRLQRGAPDAEIERHLAAADRAFGGGRSARSKVLTTQMRRRSALPRFDIIATELGEVWAQRDRLDGTVSSTEVGLTLASTYLQWAADLPKWRALSTGEDRQSWIPETLPTEAELAALAEEVLLELAPTVAGHMYLRHVLEAYLGLAKGIQLPAPAR